MSRIYHYDTTYEQEAEDGTVTASIELRIFYTVTWGREATRDEPGYNDTAELNSVDMEGYPLGKRTWLTVKPWPLMSGTLWDWSEDFVEKHQADLITNAADIEQGERDAAAGYRNERP